MADNFDLRQYLVENKLGPFAKAKSINEASGIEGVVNKDMLREFLIAASDIVEDLEPEGFDEEDVIIYLEKQLDSLSLSMLRANIPTRKRTGSGSQFESSEDMAVDMLKKGITEATPLKLKGFYQILDPGMNEWHDDFQYMGTVAGGSSAGEVGEHMFIAPDAPGSFAFVSIPEADLATMVKPSMNESKDSLQEYQIEVDDEGYATDDEGTRKFVGKQYAGQTLPNWPSGKAEPFDAKASFIPRNAVQTHERPKKTADQEEKEKNEIDLITKELIDRGLFSPDTKVKSGEMVTSQTVGRLKHNEDIRNAISDIADKHDISYSVKNKYWHKFW